MAIQRTMQVTGKEKAVKMTQWKNEQARKKRIEDYNYRYNKSKEEGLYKMTASKGIRSLRNSGVSFKRKGETDTKDISIQYKKKPR